MTSCKIDQEHNYYVFPIQDYEVHQFVLKSPVLPSPVKSLNTVILNSNEIVLNDSRNVLSCLSLLEQCNCSFLCANEKLTSRTL